jgi:hypothetical protein
MGGAKLGDTSKVLALLARLPAGYAVVRMPGLLWGYWQIENQYEQVIATGDELSRALEAALDGQPDTLKSAPDPAPVGDHCPKHGAPLVAADIGYECGCDPAPTAEEDGRTAYVLLWQERKGFDDT